MKVSIIDLIPKDARLEQSDVSHLFCRHVQDEAGYCCQDNPHAVVSVWRQAIQEVLDEEYNGELIMLIRN